MTPKEKAKDQYLKRTYNITLAMRQEVLEFQNYACYICKVPESYFKNSLAVDHCHETGKVRGLLCWRCNRAIQKFEDLLLKEETHMADRLGRAANYIEFNPFYVVFGTDTIVPPSKVKPKRRRKRKAKPKVKAKRRR